MGHHVKFLSVTNGDAGHQSQGGGMLAKRRIAETQEVAKRLGVSYDVLDNHDGELLPTLAIRLEIIRKIRQWKADVVIAPRSNDYHPDHRYTGVLVQDAAFMVGVPNVAPDVEPLRKNPVFLYFQDHFKKPNPFQADIAVDITQVIDKKLAGLDAHQSQFYEWLPWIGNYEEEVPSDPAKHKEYLLNKRVQKPNPEVRKALEKWYGKEKADQIKYAEAFEICEYGSPATMEDIKRLFPMLGK
jgi:LmbE family N-acetylglucosaminyl deacetylase